MYQSELNSQYINLPPHPSLTPVSPPANEKTESTCHKCPHCMKTTCNGCVGKSCDTTKDQNTEDNTLAKLKRKSSKPAKLSTPIPFWTQNPNILFDPKYAFEFFPSDEMTFEQKLNAITRMVVVLTIISFVYSQKTRILYISGLTLLAIFLLFFSQSESNLAKSRKEGMISFGPDPNLPPQGDYHKKPPRPKVFDNPTPENPFSNVLMTDYDYHPDKPPAMPSFTKQGNNAILDQAKQMVIKNNPGQPDIADKLFTDLGDQMVFEQSLQPFYSNASTTIPNDQAAFADFCYGSMISAKEGNMQALARSNPPRHTMR
jgi:Family of unknown function (DUF5762)